MNETYSIGDLVTAVIDPQDNNGTEKHGSYWDAPATVILSILYSLITILSVIGNFMVIRIVIKHKSMRSNTNIFFVNLALADFLVGLLLAPTALATLINGDWIFGDGTVGNILCTMNGFAMTMCMIVSIHTLMYISIYKYFGIVYPLNITLTQTKVMLMIAASWFWAILCSIFTVTLLTNVEYKPGTLQCGAKYPDFGKTGPVVHHLLIQITDIVIPIGIIVFTQSKLLWAVKKFAVRLNEHSNVSVSQILAQRRRVTITVFIVVLTFVICWIPYLVYAFFVSFTKDKSTISNIANPVVYVFNYMNSACNPVIYGFRSQSFREYYKEFLPSNMCPTKKEELEEVVRNERRMSDFAAKYSSIKFMDESSTKDRHHV